MLEYMLNYMEPQDCFSILPFVIMLDNDINCITSCDKFLYFKHDYLSQGSVSVILTLVYPVVGYGILKARMYLHIPPFIPVCY